jgi:hypothetical protein
MFGMFGRLSCQDREFMGGFEGRDAVSDAVLMRFCWIYWMKTAVFRRDSDVALVFVDIDSRFFRFPQRHSKSSFRNAEKMYEEADPNLDNIQDIFTLSR